MVMQPGRLTRVSDGCKEQCELLVKLRIKNDRLAREEHVEGSEVTARSLQERLLEEFSFISMNLPNFQSTLSVGIYDGVLLVLE